MTDNAFILQSSPHFRDKDSVPKIMYAVIASLVPAVAASLYFFRLKALALLLCCVAACLVTEALFLWLRRKPLHSLRDGSAVITGLLLAMTLPPSLSLELAIIGAVMAIAIGKQVFGGLGYNIFNPALVGRAFLQTAFPVAMTTWIPPVALKIQTATYATPLANLRFEDAIAKGTLTPLKDLFIGNVGGCLGETSSFALILGGLYLLSRRVIDWRIPLGILLSLTAFTGVFWLANPEKYASPLFHILAGGLLIGAFFMATDLITSPITPLGTWIYALGIGLVIGLIRLFGGFAEGVMYSILFMNAFVPLLNRYTRPRILGEGGKA
ncbi:MAG: RnfABCDGE type electron transport complex subunit D [Candidatus Aminicenantes bacterium]|nr:RnfABCDGE type electron transport complex subunit D [Candidatus Aminicenantes bacterium]